VSDRLSGTHARARTHRQTYTTQTERERERERDRYRLAECSWVDASDERNIDREASEEAVQVASEDAADVGKHARVVMPDVDYLLR
jgi:hypothetical protein